MASKAQLTNDHQVYGYPRGDGRFGVRNHIVIAPSVFCTNEVTRRIGAHFYSRTFGPSGENRVIALHHGVGCCGVGFDEELALRVISNSLLHPNVGAVITVSLGCGQLCTACGSDGNAGDPGLLDQLLQGKERVHHLVVHSNGGTEAVFRQAVAQIETLIATLEQEPRQPFPVSELVLGVMNGSSDATSGLFTNPGVGHVVDWLLDHGGKAVFSQTIETLGGEQILMEKADSARSGVEEKMRNILNTVAVLRQAVENEGVHSEPTPGNIRQGISTLAEKSIGSIFKIGHEKRHRIVDIVSHGQVLGAASGLYFMDGPGQDLICMTGMVAGGAHVVFFTTGGGTPTGSPIAPTLKVTSNRSTYQRMEPNIDVCLPVEQIFQVDSSSKRRSLKEVALDTLIPVFLQICNGTQRTKAEVLGQNDFQVRQLWMTD